MKVYVSKTRYDRKPDGKEIGFNLSKVSQYNALQLDVSQLAEMCGQGYAVRAGQYKEGAAKVTKANVESNQLLMLDFDHVQLDPCEVVQYLDNIDFPANFFYFTFSQDLDVFNSWLENKVINQNVKNRPSANQLYNIYNIRGDETADFAKKWVYTGDFELNYRICWFFEKPLKPSDYEHLYGQLRHILTDAFNVEIDKTSDCGRLFFGGRTGAFVLREEPLPMAARGLVQMLEADEQGRRLNKEQIKKTHCLPDYKDIPEPEVVYVGRDWMDKLAGRYEPLDKLRRGEYLTYTERLMLITNIKYLKYKHSNNTVAKDLEPFTKFPCWEGHTFTIEQIYDKCRQSALKPVIPQVRVGKGNRKVTVPEYFANNCFDQPIIPQTKRVSQEEMDNALKVAAQQIFNKRGVQYFNAPTGSGKTEEFFKLITSQSFSTKQIYAAPTHNNLKEAEKRLEKMGCCGLLRCPESDYSDKDLMLMNLGLPKESKNKELGEFICELMKPRTGVFLMTHSLLLNIAERLTDIDRIIVDENIEDAVVKDVEITLPQMCGFSAYLTGDVARKYTEYIDVIKSTDGNTIDTTFFATEVLPILEDYARDLIEDGEYPEAFPSNLFQCDLPQAFLSPEKTLTFVVRSTFIEDSIDKNIPVLLLTATPLNSMLETIYETDFAVTEIPLAKNVGRIIQYRGETGAKGITQPEIGDYGNCEKMEQYIHTCLTPAQIENSVVLTYKGFAPFWEERGFHVAAFEDKEIHLRNNAGLDFLKGKDLIVIGKFDYPEEWYKKFWAKYGDGSELVRCPVVLSLNGVRQKLFLYQNPILQKVQLQNIQYITEQAVGRARALRTEATVYLFSNLVIRGVDAVFD
jgi:hypothetical protein